jgi:hypothetical protein
MRGALTEEIQALARDFLGREITMDELRLYPYLDFVWWRGVTRGGQASCSNPERSM